MRIRSLRLAPAALLLGALALAPGCPQQTSKEEAASPAAGELQTDDQKTLYALGLALARNLEPFGLSEAEIATVQQGLADGALGRPPKVKLEEQAQSLQNFAKARQQAAAAGEEKASGEFLAKAAAEPGAQKLDSGLIFLETQAGTGASPQATDTVKVHYHGTLRDGSVFDSSVERGQPAQFPLNRVIPCWTEGVQKMKVGGKAKLTCPAAIAYGERGAPPKIKPGAALAFDVELIEIVPTPPAPPAGHPTVPGGDAEKAAKPEAKKK